MLSWKELLHRTLAQLDVTPHISGPEEHLELRRNLCSWLILAKFFREACIIQVTGSVGKTQEHNDKILNFS